MKYHTGFAQFFIILVAVLLIGGGIYTYKQIGKSDSAPAVPSEQKTADSARLVPLVQKTTVTLSDVNNAAYVIDAGKNPVKAQFKDGVFQPEENDARSSGGLNSKIGVYAFGDINKDENSDAVVVTISGMGARDARVSELQVVLNRNGVLETKRVAIPLRAADEGKTFATIENVSIDSSGIIELRANLHSLTNYYDFTDVTREYRYGNGSLTEIR